MAFRRLLTADGARLVLGRDELAAALGDGGVVEKLLAARLIVSRDDDAGERVEIVHEALATMWPRLAEWRREDAASTRFHDRLATAAKHWVESGRAADLLWRGDALAELRHWRTTGELATTPLETEFADTSITAARRTRRARIAIVVGAFAVLAIGVIVLAVANRTIADQRASAVVSAVAGDEDLARRALADGQAGEALVYLDRAAQGGAEGAGHELLVERASRSVRALEKVLIRTGYATFVVRRDGAGNVLTVGPHTVELWRDGRVVASAAGEDGRIAGSEIVALAGGELLRGTRWRVPVHGLATGSTVDVPVALETAGDLAVVFGGTAAHVFELADGHQRWTLPHAAPVQIAAFAPDARRLATVDASGAITVWDLQTGEKRARCATPPALSRTVVFVGELVVSGGYDGLIRVCDAGTGQVTRQLAAHRAPIVSLSRRDDGAIVSTSLDGTAQSWNVANGSLLGVYGDQRGGVRVARFSPDRTRLATGGDDGAIRIWDLETSAQLAVFRSSNERIIDIVWDQPGQLDAARVDGTITRWNLSGVLDIIAKPFQRLSGVEVHGDLAIAFGDDHAVAWNPAAAGMSFVRVSSEAKVTGSTVAGDRIITAHDDGQLMIWTRAGKLVRAVASGDHGITAVARVRGDRFVTLASGGVLRLWRADGEPAGVLRLGYDAELVAVDPDVEWLAVASYTSQGTVVGLDPFRVLAQLPTGEIASMVIDHDRLAVTSRTGTRVFGLDSWSPLELPSLTMPLAVQLLPDGRIVTAADDGVAVWDRAGNPVAMLAAPTRVITLAASPDDALIAGGTVDGQILLWEAATYRPLVAASGHRGMVQALAFSPDSSRLTSGGSDGRVATWDLARHAATRDELATLVRCRVPFALVGGTLLPRKLDYDPACR